MRGKFMIVVLAVLFSLPVGAVFAIDFFNDSFTPLYADIIIEWTNNTHYTYKFQVGEVVNFTIFFFYKENPIDPEAMNLTLSIYEPYSFDVKKYPLNATRISKGRYRGNFTILEDWDGKQGGVNVNFTYGGYLAGAESDIFDIGEVVVEELTLQLTSNISMIDMVSPGDTVTLYLKALRGDELVDLDLRYLNTMVSVDTGNFNVDYTLPGNFPLNRVGKGIYTITVTVPDNIPCYGKFDVLVMYSDPFHDDFSLAYYIFKADPFPVWVNLIDKGGESYTVDVYVYDSNGMTLSGATVETLTEEGDKISSTTDSVGRARLTIPFQGEEVPSRLPLKITYGGISQYGSVYYHWMTKEYEAPYFEDFEVLATEYQSNLDPWVVILPPGEHTVNFTAYYNYEAYTKPIIAYIRNETTVVAYNLTPDSAGHFTMNFTVANGSYLFATFRAEMENGGWNETYLYIIGSNESEKRITLRDLISDEVEVSHTSLYPGGEIEFNINYTGEMSDEMAVLFDMYIGEVKLDESPAIWWTPSFNNFTYLYPGAVHVQRSSLRSPETRVKLKMPLLPPDLRGRNVTFIWGYIPSLDIGTLVDKLFGSYMGDIFISADLFLTEFLKNFKLQVVTIPWEEGEGILSARVTNETGSPVAGATVTVGNATVKTDDDGSFSLHLPVGVYHITISAEGYVPWE
ncbi:MAG: carboxypeptidase regulatory-like domain-containing protein, partial [Thermoplasmata archaeon]|nr:carboxypeptidase regulatory-like domain-containing protein [Thermoplasmata archaeon]